jgi:hypothetical protein
MEGLATTTTTIIIIIKLRVVLFLDYILIRDLSNTSKKCYCLTQLLGSDTVLAQIMIVLNDDFTGNCMLSSSKKLSACPVLGAPRSTNAELGCFNACCTLKLW